MEDNVVNNTCENCAYCDVFNNFCNCIDSVFYNTHRKCNCCGQYSIACTYYTPVVDYLISISRISRRKL